MNVLFVWTDLTTVDTPRIHLGLPVMAELLERAGHRVGLLHYRAMPAREEVAAAVRTFDPHLVAFSAKTGQWPYCRTLARWIDEVTDAPILFGGRHATHEGPAVLAEPCIDFTCKGEGEDFIVELADLLAAGRDVTGLRNLGYRASDGHAVENPVRPLIDDLDALPFGKRELFAYPAILKARGGVLSIMAGRGCPYGCTYCAAPETNNIYKGLGMPVRKLSPERLIEELEHWRARYPQIRRVDFEDDVFALHVPWVQEFAPLYARQVGLPFTYLARVEATRREILEPLRAAGAVLIKVGLESGDEWLRRHVLNRRMSNARIREVFAEAHALGYRTQAFVMVGLPEETRERAEATFRLLEEIDPHEVSPAIFFPFPGTPLYEQAKQSGMWKGDAYVGDCYQECVLDHPHMNRAEIKRLFHRFTDERAARDVRRAPRGSFDLLARRAEAECRSTAPDEVRVTDLGLSFPERYGLFVAGHTEWRWRLPAAGGTLRLWFGVHPVHQEFPGRVRFRVRWGDEVLLDRTLAPAACAGDRGWHEATLELAGAGVASDGGGAAADRGGPANTALLALESDDGVTAPPYPMAAWGRPYLEPAPVPEVAR